MLVGGRGAIDILEEKMGAASGRGWVLVLVLWRLGAGALLVSVVSVSLCSIVLMVSDGVFYLL